MRVRQAGHRPLTGSTEQHRQRSGKTWPEQAGQALRGGCPAPVLRANTLARIRGPASKPAPAPAMIQAGVTHVLPAVWLAGPNPPPVLGRHEGEPRRPAQCDW
jgi:hypothetical protein